MRKIKFYYSTGYCGMDDEEIVEYPDDVTDEQLDRDAWEGAVSNADMYGITPQEDGDDPWGDQEEEPCYIGDSIEGWWEDYND